MIAAWMLYSTVVATLLSLAALALERAAAVLGRSRRWTWVGAATASVALPVVAILGVGPAAGAADLLPGGAEDALRAVLEPLVVAPDAVGRAMAQGLGGIELLLVVMWLLGSGVMTLACLRSSRTLARRLPEWERVTAVELGLDAGDGPDLPHVPIRLTDEIGPAVVGFRRAEILLPRWCLELSPAQRTLVLVHEMEHLKSGDARLLLAARCALVCVPWLLPLWWQVRRLRLAVEIDCDGRVLRRNVRPAHYGELLLEVGRRRGTRPMTHAVAALAEPVSNLERRIRAMTESTPRRRWLHASLAGVAAFALAAAACESPTPAEDASTDAAVETAAEVSAPVGSETVDGAGGAVPTEPAYIPRDVEPRLLNGEELSRALQRRTVDHGPDGPKGSATLMMFIDEEGRVADARIRESSGHDELDSAAKEVVKLARFEPAKEEDEAIAVWVLQQVEFRPSE